MAKQHGRKKTTASGSAKVHKRGSGVSVNGGKPVGRPNGYGGRPSGSSAKTPRPHNSYGKVTHGNSVERGLLTSIFGVGENTSSSASSAALGTGSIFSLSGIISLLKTNKTARIIAVILAVFVIYWLVSSGQCSNMAACGSFADIMGGYSSMGVAGEASTEQEADLSVSNEARAKRTVIKGDGEDVFTIMIYMCGTDLESKYGMATADLQEMIAAKISSKVNVIIETGGTQKWKNSTISSSTNQIYQMTDGGLVHLKDLGKKSMIEPGTLSEFIKYCTANYPADRYGLIMWDHGGGSISGYGYDQLYPNGSMTLDEINTALKNGGCEFDFIGFDACLMATLETALVAEQYADYLIASEETEPGVGWYYTNWLTALSQNTSMSTVELGKEIIDDFVDYCRKSTPNDKTTLSIIDLAEMKGTVPESFTAFAQSTTQLIENNEYQQISDARSATREFASGIDQVDLIDLANKIGTPESKAFASDLKNCVKYNRTSSNIANANGISIYFPYGTSSSMSSALKTYDKIGLDDTYGECIKSFASVSAGGQIANGNGASLLGSLFGGSQNSGSGSSLLSMIELLGGSSSSNSGNSNTELIGTVLEMFLSNNSSSQSTGIDVGQLASWFSSDKVLAQKDYIAENYLDPDHIVITQNSEGRNVLSLTEEEWDLVQTIELNVFYDDGAGYIDLGRDNVFERDENGDLFIEYDNTWLTIDGHVVSYYMISEDWDENEENYVITGRIPAMLNGELVDIIVVFDNENEEGVIAGARMVYDGETDTVAKGLIQLENGDVIDFLCDYYSYDQTYTESYYLGEQLVVNGEPQIRNMDIGSGTLYSYCLTDIYGNELWTEALEA